MRKVKLENEEFYHVYNRGVDKREVFLDRYDYLRFLKSLQEFNRVECSVLAVYTSKDSEKNHLETRFPSW